MSTRFLPAFLMLLLFAPAHVAQEQTKQAGGLEVPNAPYNCEMNIAYLEQVAMMTLEQTKNGGVLIAVARLGVGERSRESNHRRLYNVREYIKNRVGIQAERIIVAEGERAKGLGRVEFYLGGKMVGVLLLGKNKDLCLLCCEEIGPYYPHKDNLESKRKRN